MKIGIFSDQYYPQTGGIVSSIMTLRQSLINKGHEVTVVTIAVPNFEDEEDNIVRIKSYGDGNVRTPLFINREVLDIIKSKKFDVIHTHTEFFIGILGRTMGKKLKIPVVHTCHTNYESFMNYTVSNNALKKIAAEISVKIANEHIKKSDLTIVPSEKSQEDFRKYNLYKNLRVVPTGINLAKFSKKIDEFEIDKLKKELGIAQTDKVILSLSRLSSEKRIDLLINEYDQMLKNSKGAQPIKLLIVGDGPEKEALLALVKEKKLESNVIFTGNIDQSEISIYYRISDVFVTASLAETQGLSIIEAMASGTLVLAVEDKNIKNVVEDRVSGRIFYNDDDLSGILQEMLEYDESKSCHIIENAKTIADQYSLDKFSRNILNVYELSCASYMSDGKRSGYYGLEKRIEKQINCNNYALASNHWS